MAVASFDSTTTVRNVEGAQDYISCSLCQSNVQFYCRNCHDNFCQKCKDLHLESGTGENRHHEIVPYREKNFKVSDSPEAVKTINVPVIEYTNHISCLKSGHAWVSDRDGKNLVLIDKNGAILDRQKTNGGYGYHSPTEKGDLLLLEKRSVKKLSGTKIESLIENIEMEPTCIKSSKLNADILVAMKGRYNGKIVRYNQAGKEMQQIVNDEHGKELYQYPHFITENVVNEDVCVSDRWRDRVTVVDKSGRHRFYYSRATSGGQFSPGGIAADKLGHILVYEGRDRAVHIINRNGQFLSILIEIPGDKVPDQSLGIDNENRLWCGHNNTVRVYQYLYYQES